LCKAAGEIVGPFRDLLHAPRALWGINLSYILEGVTYFGAVGLLAIFFNSAIGLDDIDAGRMVGFLTAGITIAMLFLGATVDVIGPRRALLISLSLMLIGRVLLALSPETGTSGLWSSAHLVAMGGLLGIILGYGIYQPACYAAVKLFADERAAAMGYAMLYALMNLGAFLPGLFSPPIRKAFGITGVFWVYVGLTVVGIVVIAVFLTRRAMERAMASAGTASEEAPPSPPATRGERVRNYVRNFPLRDTRFLVFIFVLIPVQTLFAHNWLTLPQYCSRAFEGIVSENFEFFFNISPLLIFVLTPLVAALTIGRNTYAMMIWGTFIMAAPTFLLVLGPNIWTLFAYLLIMTVGEAIWSPRFLQWIAEVAPPNMTGIYMGLGQFPWFLTKVITSLYSGWFLMRYCPEGVPPAEMNTEMMWFIHGTIAITTPVALVLLRRWMVKGFKTRHGG
jgi:POT family proton-dependent oligopeptide transporter